MRCAEALGVRLRNVRNQYSCFRTSRGMGEPRRFNDVFVGFSRYSSNQYVSANYAFRAFNDLLNTMQTERAFKNGEDSYWKKDGNNLNRWGDYSATSVDPVNDADFLDDSGIQFTALRLAG